MNNKYKKLLISIILDIIGFIPIPVLSIIWAPISGYIMTKMYKGTKGKVAGVVSFLEELLPLDVIPTFTIMWIYSYVLFKPKNKEILKN